MSTDLDQPTEVTRQSLSDGVARLQEWAATASAVHSLAKALVSTSFVPEAFRGRPDEATAAILAGAEVGLFPMASLRSFDIISGTAAPRAITQRAVVQSFGHEIILVESSDTRCVMKGRRRGATEWQKSTWTIQRAAKMKLTGRDQWVKQPEAMLIARATGEICRLVAADAILGIGYSIEELADDATPEPAATVTRLPTTRQRASAAPAPPPAPAPNPEPPLEPEPDEIPTEPEPVTASQLKKIGTVMSAIEMTDRTEALAFVSGVVGRDITSRNELSKDEASRVIDRLEVLEAVGTDEGDEPELSGWNG